MKTKMLKIIIISLILLSHLAVIAQTTWTGAVDNDWHKPCNWNTLAVPTCIDDVIIPSVTNKPVISATACVKSITPQTGAGLTIQSLTLLQIGPCPCTPTENSGGESTDPTGASASPNPVCQGSSTDLSVTGGSLGTGASWKWYSGSCGGTFVGTGSPLSVSPASTTTYYVRAEGTCNTTSCASVVVTVNTAPSITFHPSDQIIYAGNNASFSVTATGAGLTYQWQENDGISGWLNISNGGTNPAYSGALTTTLTLTYVPIGYNGYDYRCVVIGTCSPSATSNSANLTVNPFTCGTATVDDVDGNTYNTVLIGTQCWMAENLKTTKYKNSTAIPNVTDDATWVGLSTGAYADYNNNPVNSTTYGRLYNWYAVNNANGICPTGWHVPTDAEWCTMENTVEAGTDPACNLDDVWRGTNTGAKLKEAGTVHWNSPNACGTGCNTSGFTGLPGGYRWASGFFAGEFAGDRYYAWWWTATIFDATNVWARELYYSDVGILRGNYVKTWGFSMRCLKD